MRQSQHAPAQLRAARKARRADRPGPAPRPAPFPTAEATAGTTTTGSEVAPDVQHERGMLPHHSTVSLTAPRCCTLCQTHPLSPPPTHLPSPSSTWKLLRQSARLDCPTAARLDTPSVPSAADSRRSSCLATTPVCTITMPTRTWRSSGWSTTSAPHPPTRAERGNYEIIPARRANAAFSAASESKELKWPFQLLL